MRLYGSFSSEFINLNVNFRKTRTGILTLGYPPMIPDDLSRTRLSSALDGARTVYSDFRFYETALVVAREVIYIFFYIESLS